MPKPKMDDAHLLALRAETEARKHLVDPLVPLVLERARDLLDDKNRWTKGTVARDADGAHVLTTDSDAVQWCAVGAMEKCSVEVWRTQPMAKTWPDGWSVLNGQVQEAAAPHIAAAAKELDRDPWVNGRVTYASIPGINDHDKNGGYTAVITGLYLATGKTIADRVALFVKRSQAARKAWQTRKDKQHAEWLAYMTRRDEEKAAREALARQTMVIEGTITSTVSPQINADAKKEIVY